MNKFALVLIGAALASATSFADRYAATHKANLRNKLGGGWNVLSDAYKNSSDPNYVLDSISKEWDYYSIHSDAFTGSVSFTFTDPRGSAADTTTSGGAMALLGKLRVSGEHIQNYHDLGLNFTADANSHNVYAEKNGHYWRSTSIAASGKKPAMMHIQAVSVDYTWDLYITRAFPERDSLPARQSPWQVGNDIQPMHTGLEHWTVDMVWPTTLVSGSITRRSNGEVFNISGHGYREVSFGRWAVYYGGWDFNFFSDMEQGIEACLQTYHQDTEDVDFLDLAFVDPRNHHTRSIRFEAAKGELGWEHSSWKWDATERVDVPLNSHILASNSEYTVEWTSYSGPDYMAMHNSDALSTPSVYLVLGLWPHYNGTIRSTHTGEVLLSFTNVLGGGEFSTPYVPFNSDSWVSVWVDTTHAFFKNTFKHYLRKSTDNL